MDDERQRLPRPRGRAPIDPKTLDLFARGDAGSDGWLPLVSVLALDPRQAASPSGLYLFSASLLRSKGEAPSTIHFVLDHEVDWDAPTFARMSERLPGIIELENPEIAFEGAATTRAYGFVCESKRVDGWAKSALRGASGDPDEMLVVANRLGPDRKGSAEHPPDWNASLRWFEAAARLGCSEAFEGLSNIYANGHGVPADATRGLAFKRRARRPAKAQ